METNTFFIYHKPGVKVGCTMNLKQRHGVLRSQDVELLQVLINVTRKEAGDIEWAWADKFGYPRGRHYTSAGHRLGKAVPPETKTKMREAKLGVKKTDEHVDMMKRALHNRWTPERRKAMRELMNQPEMKRKCGAKV